MLESELIVLKRKELQVLAKQHGLKANLKSSELIASLLALYSSTSIPKDETVSEPMLESEQEPTVMEAKDENAAGLTPVLPESVPLEAAVGVSVRFIDEIGEVQEGTIKRINKNSFRIKLNNGKEVTIPKANVEVVQDVKESKVISPECLGMPKPDIVVELFHDGVESPPPVSAPSVTPTKRSSSTKKKKKSNKKSLTPKHKPSRVSGEITISPIKSKPASPTLTPTVLSPQCNAGESELDSKEQLIIDEDYCIDIPKKKRKSSNKKKVTPGKKNASIAVSSLQARSKSLISSAKKVKQPSIVPKTTATMRARADAISKKKQLMSDMKAASTPQQSTVLKSASKSTVGRSKCTIDSSILDKINQSSRRFSSSWSSSKPRKSVSLFSDNLTEAKPIASISNGLNSLNKPAASVKPDITTQKSVVRAKSVLAARPSTASAQSQRASSTVVRSRSAAPSRPVPTHVRRQMSTSGNSAPPRKVTSAIVKNKSKPTSSTLSAASSPGSVSSKNSRSSTTKVTKPNPNAFLKRSTGIISARSVAAKSVTSENVAAKRMSKPVASGLKSRPSVLSQNKLATTAQECENVPKPFKARPAPNFSKIHKNIFNVDKSVIHMVKEVCH